jgi:hypothetical protein
VVPDVLLIGGDARCGRAEPGDPPKPGWDVALIQAGIVAAVAADELKYVGIAALRLAINHAGRLAP